MENILNAIREKVKYSYLILIFLGIFMLFFPGTTLKLASIIIGIILILKGTGKGQSLFYIIMGVIFIANTRFISGILPTLLGILLFVSGRSNITKMKAAKNANIRGSNTQYILAWVEAGLGVVMFLCPFFTAKIITKLIAICLIYLGVSDILFSKTELKFRAEITDADDVCTPVDE